MKKIAILPGLFVLVLTIVTSCTKQPEGQMPASNDVARKVQFILYTDKDLSSDINSITFKLSIQKINKQVRRGPGLEPAVEVLWDSILAPMKIKDIPGLAEKLVFEKTVTTKESALLKVGFYYSIENVGHSQHLDSFDPGETFKILDFNFQ